MIPTTQSRKPLYIWLLTILVLSMLPPSVIEAPEIDHIDLLAHAVLYAVTGALFYVEFRSSQKYARSAGIMAVLFASAYGLLMEVIQNYIPQREFSLLDAAANAVGACIGVWLVYLMIRSRQKRLAAAGPAKRKKRR